MVARVVEDDSLLKEALYTATHIAKHSQPIIEQARQAVNQSLELPLSAGLIYEQQAFYSTFAFDDQKEGMEAFLHKRPPDFQDK